MFLNYNCHLVQKYLRALTNIIQIILLIIRLNILTPAIFAIAYASFVGSSLPLNKYFSLIGCLHLGYIQLDPKKISFLTPALNDECRYLFGSLNFRK